MIEHIPYWIFVAGAVAAMLCAAGLACTAYGRSAKLRDMVRFVVSPVEYDAADRAAGSIVKTFLWFFVIHLSVTALFHVADLALFGDVKPANSVGSAADEFPVWFILAVPPLLEEIAFRLPLRRRRGYVALSAAALAFIVSAPIAGTIVYEVSWPRIAVAAAAAAIFWRWGYAWTRRVDFRVWFWGVAVLFSILHMANYGSDIVGVGGWIRVLFAETARIPSALMFGYVRLRHGFGVAIVLHLINNILPFLLVLGADV